MPDSGSILELRDVVTGFGPHQVLHGVSFEVPAQGVTALLGLNGAGKSVTLKTISGLLKPWSGEILLSGEPIHALTPEQRVGRGLAHVPQGRAVFPALSVEQNLRLGAYTVRDTKKLQEAFDHVYGLFPRLHERRPQAAGTLSGGEQEMLAVGRALMSFPKVVLVDEPSQGLAPVVVEGLMETLRAANEAGTTVLMVEQNVSFALDLAGNVLLMQRGQIVYSGGGRDLDTGRIMSLLGVGDLVRIQTGDR
ncbi:MAG TPA: ABC transporter ATP-binding protein [Actinomycetota bacterium]|nr:ABC transporter ATP-binding protein [Actinomycetota bacterium]